MFGFGDAFLLLPGAGLSSRRILLRGCDCVSLYTLWRVGDGSILFENDVTKRVAKGVVFICEFEGGGGFGTTW